MADLDPFEAAYRAYLAGIKQAWADVDIDSLPSSLESSPTQGGRGCQGCGEGFSTWGTLGTFFCAGTATGGTLGSGGTLGTFGSTSGCIGHITEQAGAPAAGTLATYACIGTFASYIAQCWGTASTSMGSTGPEQEGPRSYGG